jgi:hypothetical protein
MGSLTGPVDGDWVGHLRTAARGAQPIKWEQVQHLLTSTSGDAVAVRDGLAQAVIVIVDPMVLLRGVDFAWMKAGGLPPVAMWHDVPELRALRRHLDRHAAEGLIALSGAQRILGLLTQTLGIVNLDDGVEQRVKFSPAALCERLGGSLRKATLLAASATTAIAYEQDPEGREGFAELGGMTRFAIDDFVTRARLEAFADRRVIFDGGHEDVVRLVSELHQEAKERCARYAPYLGLESDRRGYITTGDDREQLRLQLADVAAGYARDVLDTYGLVEACRRFRLVLFNGRRLDGDDARRYDDERRAHRTLVAKCLGGTSGVIHVN